jgi:hypothetical protein
MHTATEHTPRPLLNAIVTRAVLLTSSIDGHVADVSSFPPFSNAICKKTTSGLQTIVFQLIANKHLFAVGITELRRQRTSALLQESLHGNTFHRLALTATSISPFKRPIWSSWTKSSLPRPLPRHTRSSQKVCPASGRESQRERSEKGDFNGMYHISITNLRTELDFEPLFTRGRRTSHHSI